MCARPWAAEQTARRRYPNKRIDATRVHPGAQSLGQIDRECPESEVRTPHPCARDTSPPSLGATGLRHSAPQRGSVTGRAVTALQFIEFLLEPEQPNSRARA